MRDSVAEIDISALRHNLTVIRRFQPASSIAAVVKANAYGMGAVAVAKALEEAGAEYLCTAFVSEAVELRKAGITLPILVLVTVPASEYSDIVSYGLDCTLITSASVQALSAEALRQGRKVKIHLPVDTGMHRDGVQPEAVIELAREIESAKGLELIGLMTHLATSDSEDETFALKQQYIFDKVIAAAQDAGLEFRYIHCYNSGGIVKFRNPLYNMVRPGISLHGYQAAEYLADGFRPALRLTSRVIDIKEVKKGETAGYSFRYIAEEDTRVALIPVGYGDGFPVAFANNARCLINGGYHPLVGSICMDQSIINIGSADVKTGDEVVLMGKGGQNEITLYELASRAKTIPYEILTALAARVPRVYIP